MSPSVTPAMAAKTRHYLLVQWVRREEPAHAPTAGWDLLLNGTYRGVVWLDGNYTGPESCMPINAGCPPLAAQALLRATGVER